MSDINVGQLSETINDKMDRDAYNAENGAFANLTQALNIDYVVEWQTPTAQNNYTWYRLYASGWIEQGGAFATVSGSYFNENVVFPKEMANIGYCCNIATSASGDAFTTVISSKSTTGFTVMRLLNASAYYANWQVSGMSAQES